MCPRNRCDRCAGNVSPTAERCITCGGRAVPRRSPRSRLTTAIIVTVLSVIVLLAVGLSDRYVPAVADWYSRMAIEYVPEPALPYLPGATEDDRAFYQCARTVVRKIENERSVVTFPEPPGTLTDVGEGRFELRSIVDEAIEDGEVLRRSFVCQLHEEGVGNWRVDDVQLEPLSEARLRGVERRG